MNWELAEQEEQEQKEEQQEEQEEQQEQQEQQEQEQQEQDEQEQQEQEQEQQDEDGVGEDERRVGRRFTHQWWQCGQPAGLTIPREHAAVRPRPLQDVLDCQ